MKQARLFSIFVSAAVFCCICTPVHYSAAETKAITLGDVDNNGVINAVDASSVLAEYANTSSGHTPTYTDIQKLSGDVDKNGELNAVDASKILAYYAYNSTGGTLSLEDFIIPQNVPQELIINGYSKYDIFSTDKEIAVAAFSALSEQLWHELYAGVGIDRGYLSNGRAESKVAIAILNYNSISPEVLASTEALGNYSEEDIITYAHALDFEVVEEMTGTRVDFSKYMLDQDFADFINRTNAAWIDYENGNEDEYLNIIWNENCDSNLIKKYYVKLASASTYDADGIDMEHLYNAMDEYDENIVRPMYNNYQQYVGKS